MVAAETSGTGRKILIASPGKAGSSLKWWLLGFAVVFAVAALTAVLAAVAPLGFGGGNVALIRVSGSIGGGDGVFGGGASPDEIVSMIEQAEKSPAVHAILIEINSPGGSPVASEELMKAVRDAKKPSVALIRDIGTSGAYWAASAADFVVASPVSLTGSIGVTGSYLQFSQLLNDYGVRYERLVSAERKDIASPFRNLTPEEKAALQDGLAKMHEYFLGSVKENRKLADANASVIARLSTAMVFLGSEAKELGLVDELGGRKEAEAWLKRQANLTEISYVSYDKKPLFDIGTLLAEQSSAAGAAFGKSMVAGFFTAASQSVRA